MKQANKGNLSRFLHGDAEIELSKTLISYVRAFLKYRDTVIQEYSELKPLTLKNFIDYLKSKDISTEGLFDIGGNFLITLQHYSIIKWYSETWCYKILNDGVGSAGYKEMYDYLTLEQQVQLGTLRSRLGARNVLNSTQAIADMELFIQRSLHRSTNDILSLSANEMTNLPFFLVKDIPKQAISKFKKSNKFYEVVTNEDVIRDIIELLKVKFQIDDNDLNATNNTILWGWDHSIGYAIKTDGCGSSVIRVSDNVICGALNEIFIKYERRLNNPRKVLMLFERKHITDHLQKKKYASSTLTAYKSQINDVFRELTGRGIREWGKKYGEGGELPTINYFVHVLKHR